MRPLVRPLSPLLRVCRPVRHAYELCVKWIAWYGVSMTGVIAAQKVAYMAAHWVLEDHDGLTALVPRRADNMASIFLARVTVMQSSEAWRIY